METVGVIDQQSVKDIDCEVNDLGGFPDPIPYYNYTMLYDDPYPSYISSSDRCQLRRSGLLKQRNANPLKWDDKYKKLLSVVNIDGVTSVYISNISDSLFETKKVSEKSIYQDFIKNFWYNPEHRDEVEFIIKLYKSIYNE